MRMMLLREDGSTFMVGSLRGIIAFKEREWRVLRREW